MTKATLVSGVISIALVTVGLAIVLRSIAIKIDEATSAPAAGASAAAPGGTGAGAGLIHGRITTDDGGAHEGTMRWGGDQEALWGHYFNGFKQGNPWAAQAPRGSLANRSGFSLFGIQITGQRLNLERPFMIRFGDITRIESLGRDIRVTLKSGLAVDLDRFGSDDLADGVRVRDAGGAATDLDESQIRSIEFRGAAGGAPLLLTGTVRTLGGEFTGLVQWNRRQALTTDQLRGNADDGERSVRFEAIRSIRKRPGNGTLVTLIDGTEIGLSGTREAGEGHLGVYVDDPRYGRVLISWGAFLRLDLAEAVAGPAYTDFLPGHPLTGSVVTQAGRRLAGRLVFDLDESETTETLDAPREGVSYNIPFGLIASIVSAGSPEREGRRATITLHGGEQLQLDQTGDLGDGNAGMLIFADGGPQPEYVAWADIREVAFDRPAPATPPTARERGPR